MAHSYIREKSLERYGCTCKQVEWYEYSDAEQQAVRQSRKTKARASPPKTKKLNDERSRNYFRWLLQNNFGRGDYHITLTFAKEIPRDKARKEFANYIRRIRRVYDKAGTEVKYLYVCEGKHSGARLHYHLVVSGGVNRDILESKWELGFANTDRLQPDSNTGLDALARYLTKTKKHAEKHERAWNGSTNLTRPDIGTDDNRITRKKMRQLQTAARNDEAGKLIERIYQGWSVIEYEIGHNAVTGRPYARMWLLRKKTKGG